LATKFGFAVDSPLEGDGFERRSLARKSRFRWGKRMASDRNWASLKSCLSTGYRWFEFTSLHRRVYCEPEFSGGHRINDRRVRGTRPDHGPCGSTRLEQCDRCNRSYRPANPDRECSTRPSWRAGYRRSTPSFKLPRRGHFFAARSAKKRRFFSSGDRGFESLYPLAESHFAAT
jgi:hypothetical protein